MTSDLYKDVRYAKKDNDNTDKKDNSDLYEGIRFSGGETPEVTKKEQLAQKYPGINQEHIQFLSEMDRKANKIDPIATPISGMVKGMHEFSQDGADLLANLLFNKEADPLGFKAVDDYLGTDAINNQEEGSIDQLKDFILDAYNKGSDAREESLESWIPEQDNPMFQYPKRAGRAIPMGMSPQSALGMVIGEDTAEAVGLPPLIGGLVGANPNLAYQGLKSVSSGLEQVRRTGDRLYKSAKNFNKENKIPDDIISLKEVSPRGRADVELRGKDLKNNLTKVSDETIDKLRKTENEISTVRYANVADFDVKNIEKDLVKEAKDQALNKIAEIKVPMKDYWATVQKNINQNYKVAQDNKRIIYTEFEKALGEDLAPNKYLYDSITEVNKELDNTLIQSPSEKTLKSNLTSISEGAFSKEKRMEKYLDLIVERKNPMAMRTYETLKNKGLLEDLNVLDHFLEAVNVPQEPMTMKNLAATVRSLNEIIDYDELYPSAKTLLKNIRKAALQDLEKGLEKNPIAKGLKEQGDRIHKLQAQRFRNKDIAELRFSENPEAMGQHFSTPSKFARLQEAVYGQDKLRKSTNRVLLDNISKGNENVLDKLNEFKGKIKDTQSPIVLPETFEAANFIDKKLSKNAPIYNANERQKLITNLINDYISTEQLPPRLLSLLESNTLRAITKKMLSTTPKGKTLYNHLLKLKVRELNNSFIKNGEIDFTKMKEVFTDDELRKTYTNIFKELDMPRAMDIYTNIESMSKNIQSNIEAVRKQDPTFLKKMSSMLGHKYAYAAISGLQGILGLTVGLKTGLAGITAGAATSYGAKKVTDKMINNRLHKILSTPEGIDVIKKASRKGLSEKETRKNIKNLLIFLAKEEEEEED